MKSIKKYFKDFIDIGVFNTTDINDFMQYCMDPKESEEGKEELKEKVEELGLISIRNEEALFVWADPERIGLVKLASDIGDTLSFYHYQQSILENPKVSYEEFMDTVSPELLEIFNASSVIYALGFFNDIEQKENAKY